MHHSLRSILHIVFAILGAFTTLAGLATITMAAIFRPPNWSEGLYGSTIYLAISLASFFAVWRLRRPKVSVQGFEVIPKPPSNDAGG